MAVVMVIGNRHDLSASVVEPGITMAAVIANEFNEAAGLQRAALFEIGLVLLAVTLGVNALARLLVWRVARDSAAGSTAL
jgi:phosphate transport system permease protein